ncbi:hypothetical protein PVAG01_00468 [Phlyctema vagabunda]|uniref:Uncharacterized protein n=1 Tax=Phlyctema vagabunda TaxID=108571 RepID=A0ABR4PUB9_9HELO
MAPSEPTPPEGAYSESVWLPIYDIRTPYDEDEIIEIITEITRIAISLGTLREDEVMWSTPVNETLCRELSIDAAVISLIRRLPYTPSAFGIYLESYTSLLDYSDDEVLRYSRAQENIPPIDLPEGQPKILPHEVCIADGDRDSPQLYLDTKENTIRVVLLSMRNDYPPGAHLEYPGQEHYRNYYPRHAPSYLRLIKNRMKSLDVIYPGLEAYGGYFIGSVFEWPRRRIMHILIGTYGWPDAFQQARWDQDRERVWNQAFQD